MIWSAQLALTSHSNKTYGRKRLQSVRDDIPRSGSGARPYRIAPPAAFRAQGISLAGADRLAHGTPY
jgi:hypothetical protein